MNENEISKKVGSTQPTPKVEIANTVLVLFDPKNVEKCILTSQRFIVNKSPFRIKVGEVQQLDSEQWSAIVNDTSDFGGQYLIGTSRETNQLSIVANGRNLIKDYVDTHQLPAKYSISELIDKTYNVELLEYWLLETKRDEPSQDNMIHIRQLQDRLEDYEKGNLVILPTIDRSFPGGLKLPNRRR